MIKITEFLIEKAEIIVAVYLIIAVIAVAVTVYDKLAAGSSHMRIPENTLLLIAVFGGALPMFLTMRLIHHKTRYSKFMIGLPMIILLELLVVLIAGWLYIRFFS